MTSDRPVATSSIAISEPVLGEEAERLILEVLRSGQLSQGPMVERFEGLVAEMAGTKHAVAVANGTIALEAALELLDVGRGDEVITSPLTFGATLNAILHRDATVRFADVLPDFTLDPAAVEAAVTDRTRVVMPVHLYGLISDMAAIEAVASERGLEVVEDAAQAHGARQGERRAGSFGLGCFSFYATKNVTAGEGGMVTTSDDGLAARLRTLRNQGMRAKYEYTSIGRNWRMTDLAAAVAIPQMERLDEIVAKRGQNADRLSRSLANSGLTLPEVPEGRTHVWHQFTVLLPQGVDRDRVVSVMADDGIGAGVYYPKLAWDHPPYRESENVTVTDTPAAADSAARCLSLPVHPRLRPDDLDRIASSLLGAVQGP